MIHQPEIWDILRRKMPRDCLVSLEEIYHIIEEQGDLDDEDSEWQSPTSAVPKWKRNVRNVLQYRKTTGEILWNKDARYQLP
jgi:hypothetical protein